LDRFLQLPLGIPAEVQRIAKQIVGKAPTHYDEALALQDWLRDPTEFTYSTDVADSVGDANGARAIAAFLDTRRGYCVHFASTMAVMARQLGIPARVAVGFTAGTRDAKGRMVVTLHDAHSWPELYFEGAGWVAFEPTPGSRTGSPPPWARAAVAPIGGGSDATAVPTPAATGGTGVNPRVRAPESFNNAKKATSGSQSVFQRLNLPKVPTVVVLIALLAGLVPSATRLVVRRRRWRGARTPADTVAAAWAELRDTLVDYGYLWRPSDSPRRGAARVSEEMALTGASDQAVRRLGAATERARYATTLGEVGDLRADVETVRAALGDATTSWGRARARWLPRSTREVAAASSERMADGFDAVDDVVATVRERVFSGRSRRGGGSTAPRPAP
jgi:hypothetical protein